MRARRPPADAVTIVGQPRIAVDSYVTMQNFVAYVWEQGDRHASHSGPSPSPPRVLSPLRRLRRCGLVTADAGQRKTVPSRPTTVSLTRLRSARARPAGPPLVDIDVQEAEFPSTTRPGRRSQ
jgi:hypothetical protein